MSRKIPQEEKDEFADRLFSAWQAARNPDGSLQKWSDVAIAAKIDPSYMFKMMAAERIASEDVRLRLAQVLSVSDAWLKTGDPAARPQPPVTMKSAFRKRRRISGALYKIAPRLSDIMAELGGPDEFLPEAIEYVAMTMALRNFATDEELRNFLLFTDKRLRTLSRPPT